MSKILRWNPKLNASRADLSDSKAPLNAETELILGDPISEEPEGEVSEGVATAEPDVAAELPDGATEDDQSFLEDASSIVTDQDGNEFTVDELVVVQNPITREISLFMPSDQEERIPEDVVVIGKVSPASDASLLDSSRKVITNSGSSHASPAENRIRELKTRLKQDAVGQIFHDTTIEGKAGFWFSKPLGDMDYVICMVPEGDRAIKVFYAAEPAASGGPERVERLLRQALSSYPTTYASYPEFLENFI